MGKSSRRVHNKITSLFHKLQHGNWVSLRNAINDAIHKSHFFICLTAQTIQFYQSQLGIYVMHLDSAEIITADTLHMLW